jgi:hypothetical protein
MQIIPTMIDYQTSLSASYFNQMPLEQTNLISSTGITPTSNDLNQTGKSVANYASVGDYYIDSGSANTYVLSPVSSGSLRFQGVTQYFLGMRIRFIPSHTNTATSTVNVNGLGIKNIKLKNGSDIADGDLEVNEAAQLYYNGTDFILFNPQVSYVTAWPQAYQYKASIANNSTNPATQIDFQVGKVRDQDDKINITLSSIVTKDISEAWAAGTGSGGLPGNLTLSPNTTYACFLIENNSGDVDAGFDTSFSAANLLVASGYTYYRRRGFIITDSSSNILAFYQSGDSFFIDDIDNSRTTLGAPGSITAVTLKSPKVPLPVMINVSLFSIGNLSENNVSVTSRILTQPSTGLGNYFSAFNLRNDGSGTDSPTNTNAVIITDSNAQVNVVAASGGNGTVGIYVIGWIDTRED